MSDLEPTPLDAKMATEQLTAAESTLLKTATNELLSASTRGERDRLLVVSLLGLIFGILGITPTQIGLGGAKLPLASTAWAFPAGITAVIAYYLFAFCVGGWLDRNRWRAFVGPEHHAFFLRYTDLVRERGRLLHDAIIEGARLADVLHQIVSLEGKKTELLTSQLKELPSDVEKWTNEQWELLYRKKEVDTSSLDAELEKLRKGYQIDSELNKLQIQRAADFPQPAGAGASEAALLYWRMQNICLIGVPILIGLLSEAITVLALVRMLRA